MIKITDKCVGCKLCEEICMLDAIKVVSGRAVVDLERCVQCKACLKVCKQNAITCENDLSEGIICCNCPVECVIPPDKTGACKRYVNKENKLERVLRLHSFSDVEDIVKELNVKETEKPLVTGIGAGTTYPDFKPSPLIAKALINNVEIVTVVTEAPLSYSGITIKVDTDKFLGEEGKKIYIISKGKKIAGHLCREEYGSKMLSLGGVNLLTGKDGLWIAKTIFDFISGKSIRLDIENGAKLELKLNSKPVINDREDDYMRIGCGSATLGLFAPYLSNIADEAVILDGHIVGMLTEHPAGKSLNLDTSGIRLNAVKSTPGRYFVEKGNGWGGTKINNPLDIIASVPDTFNGKTLFITDTTGSNFKYFIYENNNFTEMKPTKKIEDFINLMKENCQTSNVTAVFAGGVGGSARAGVTKNPIKLTKAVHNGDVKITIGGATPFIFPGGGINFIVDMGKIKKGSFYLAPTPSFIIPVEYTMTGETFKKIGGHIENITKL